VYRTLVSSPHIGSYSALLILAFVAGWWWARRNAVRLRIEPRHVDNLALISVVVGLFGARLFSWMFYLPPGYGFIKAFTTPDAGLVFYGGLICGLLAVVIYSASLRLNLRDMLDVFAAPAAVGLALGRIGCFLAGCCWGDVCVAPEMLAAREPAVRYQIQTVPALSHAGFPLAVTFPSTASAYEQHQQMHLIPPGALRSAPVHPVQLYEAALALCLALALHRSLKARARSGQVALKLVLGYSLIRFATEFFRADNQPVYGGMTISQLISLLLAAGCIGLLANRTRRALDVVGMAAPRPFHRRSADG
jgi:phosphatidylglycerol---prolipoprotein diacylglyceryl transferase